MKLSKVHSEYGAPMGYVFEGLVIDSREDWIDYVCKVWITAGGSLKQSRDNLGHDEFWLADSMLKEWLTDSMLKEWKFKGEYEAKRGKFAEYFRMLASDHDWLADWHADEIEEERLDKPSVWCVAPYLVSLAFGGHEEGGWWFDCGIPKLSPDLPFPVFYRTEREALAGRDIMQIVLDAGANKGKRPKSSVLSDGVYEAHYTEGLPKPFPETTPHYE